MKYSEKIKLMGKRVFVISEYKRRRDGNKKIWKAETCNQWEGWIVGFRNKQDGWVDYIGEGEGSVFVETGRKHCVLVAKHPSELPMFVPLDGYYLILAVEDRNEKT